MVEIRHYTLPLGAIVLAAGAVLFLLSVLSGFLGMAADLRFYIEVLPGSTAEWQGWNLFVFVLSPIPLIVGGWYVGEQITTRRRFKELLETRKKSAFRKEVPELEDLARRLPPRYRDRLRERKDELNL